MKQSFVNRAREFSSSRVRSPMFGFQQFELDAFQSRLGRDDASGMAEVIDLCGSEFLVAFRQPHERAVVHNAVPPTAFLNLQSNHRAMRFVAQRAANLLMRPRQLI